MLASCLAMPRSAHALAMSMTGSKETLLNKLSIWATEQYQERKSELDASSGTFDPAFGDRDRGSATPGRVSTQATRLPRFSAKLL